MSTMPKIEPPQGPRAVARPVDAGRTLLGIFGEPAVAAVDRSGIVQLADADWVLDWWILGADRWYTPSSEAAVRQQRLGSGPIVQTALRVSDGDVVHRTWAVHHGDRPGVVVEIENTTKAPVALALAIRPFDLDGRIGQPVVHLGEDHIQVGDTSLQFSLEVRDTMPDHNAIVIPVPHSVTARILISGKEAGDQRQIPDLATAVRAWDSLITSKSRVALPDQRLTALFDQGRGRLSLGFHDLHERITALDGSAGRELAAVALTGSSTEAGELLGRLVADDWLPQARRLDEPESLGAVADGIAWAAILHAPLLADAVLPVLTQLAQQSRRKRSEPGTQQAERALARVAKLAGQGGAARAIDRRLGLGSDPSLPQSVAALSALTQEASETGSWGDDDIEPVTQGLIALRHLLVQERWENDQPEIDLFTEWPTAWRGGAAELHALPTAFGLISAAIRWHGYRPALLWQFDRSDHFQSAIRLRCSALDPDWSTTAASGETLLAGAAGGLGQAPAEGESFS
ncbi:MAG: hypothetical protein HKN03_15625 [Acidimicrobiales bacterium]|nr:hypothetical protein [Acidimicrobiales bacterium]